MPDSHPIHQYYTNSPFGNVLQNMKEKQAKEELNDRKEKPEQEGKICRRTFWVRLGVGKPSPRLRGSPRHRHCSLRRASDQHEDS